MAVILSQRITVGAVTLKLPTGWAIERSTGDGSTVVLLARQTSGSDADDADAAGHVLIVRLYPDDQGAVSPGEFLRHSGLLRGAIRMTDTTDPQTDTAPDGHSVPALPAGGDCSMAGVTGKLVKKYRLGGPEENGDEQAAYAQWFAVALVSGGRALVLQLDCPTTDADDSAGRLIASLAAAVRVAPPVSAPQAGQDRL
jgi:hypothetical protein